MTRDPQRHEREIHRIRQRTGFRSELKYSSTDTNKVRFAQQVIDHFWHEPDLRFSARIVDTSQHDLSFHKYVGHGPRPAAVAYNYHYQKLITRATPARDELVVILDSRTRDKRDQFPNYLRREVPSIKNLQLVDSSQHQLVQLADLLVGSVYGDCTGVKSPVKREIIRSIKGRAGVTDLTDPRLDVDDKFCVQVWRPPTARG